MALRIALALLASALGCSPRGAHAPVVPRASPAHTKAAPAEALSPAQSAWPARLARLTPIGDVPFRSQHFGGSRLAETRVSPQAAARYRMLVLGTQFDEGTELVEVLRAQPGAPSLLLVLERRADGWHFGEFDAQGDPRPVDAALCNGCHAGAVAAPVFGPARAQAPRESKR